LVSGLSIKLTKPACYVNFELLEEAALLDPLGTTFVVYNLPATTFEVELDDLSKTEPVARKKLMLERFRDTKILVDLEYADETVEVDTRTTAPSATPTSVPTDSPTYPTSSPNSFAPSTSRPSSSPVNATFMPTYAPSFAFTPTTNAPSFAPYFAPTFR
jgi:hypothetical protein